MPSLMYLFAWARFWFIHWLYAWTHTKHEIAPGVYLWASRNPSPDELQRALAILREHARQQRKGG